jgi:hypothetical protein
MVRLSLGQPWIQVERALITCERRLRLSQQAQHVAVIHVRERIRWTHKERPLQQRRGLLEAASLCGDRRQQIQALGLIGLN